MLGRSRHRTVGRQRRQQLRHNALADRINGLYKAEVIHRRSLKSCEAVELLSPPAWVGWFNHRRLLEPIGHIPPTEADDRYYAPTRDLAIAA